MSTLSPRPLLPTFLPSLNALLAALALPFTLDHPTDLTPSLLLAIFESLIGARLPIPSAVRQSRTRDAKARAMLVLLGVLECDVLRGGTASDVDHSVAASNLDDSALGGAGGVSVDGWIDDIGLGEVDPERLADGGWEETIFVGELLCWLARRKGVLPRTTSSRRSPHPRSLYSNHHSYGTDVPDVSASILLQKSSSFPSVDNADARPNPEFSAFSHITDIPRHPLVHSPEPSLSASATTGTDLSIHARSVSSRTSLPNTDDDFEEASQDTVQLYSPRRMMQDAEEEDDRPPTFRPRCIHELEDPSYIRAFAGPSPFTSHHHASGDEADDPSRDQVDDVYEQDIDELYAPPTPTPRRVRLTGWIDHVDSATELSHFAASRTRTRPPALKSSADSASRLPSQLQSHKYLGRTSPLPGLARPQSPRRASSSPSPSPPPSPPLTSSRYPLHSPPSLPPSPPSSPTRSDAPFDVSFSTLNNTSTPAKPRLPRRSQLQTNHETKSDWSDRDESGRNIATVGRHRDGSPSYTPSPPSFSTPGGLRSGGASCISGTRIDLTKSTRIKAHTTSAPSTTMTSRTKSPRSTSPSPTNDTGKSPSLIAPPGSTTTTNTLLTERARLLTELAALKRARAANTAGPRAGTGRGGGVVGRSHRIGVGG